MMIRAYTILGLLLLMAGPALPQSRVGVVLVHGKGSAALAAPSVAWDYWGSDMIDALTTQQTVPFLVAAYDGTASVYTSANRVAAEIAAFIAQSGVQYIVVVAHSFGGTVFREIASEPDPYTDRCKSGHCSSRLTLELQEVSRLRSLVVGRTRVVWTIASPHLGSEAANLAWLLGGPQLTGWLIDLIGQKNLATVYCTTGRMDFMNRYHLLGTAGRPSLPQIWRWVAARDTPLQVVNDGLHPEDYQLSAVASIVGFPGGSDGVVGFRSATAVGEPYYISTHANHHHSRRHFWPDRQIGDFIGYTIIHGR